MIDHIVDGVTRFKADVFPHKRALYEKLARHGQSPKALVISCSDSRVVPEIITQSEPGDLFVTRNAGNVVPPFSEVPGGVTAAIEYAVVGLGVSDIVVCGHTDCGAMKALLDPDSLKAMPSVAKWLGHCRCAQETFRHARRDRPQATPASQDADAPKDIAMANVAAQLINLRTHPSVAARVATGELTLHGWVFDIENGSVLALDGEDGHFSPIEDAGTLPVALPAMQRPRPRLTFARAVA